MSYVPAGMASSVQRPSTSLRVPVFRDGIVDLSQTQRPGRVLVNDPSGHAALGLLPCRNGRGRSEQETAGERDESSAEPGSSFSL